MASNDTSVSDGSDVTFKKDLVNTCIPVPADPEDTPLGGTKESSTMLVVALSIGGSALLLTVIIVSVYMCRKKLMQ